MDWRHAIVAYAVLTAGWATLAKMAREAGLSGAATSLICSLSASAVVIACNVPQRGTSPWPLRGIALALGAGLLGGGTSLIYYRILKSAPFASVQPLTELYIILIPLIALFVFHEVPTGRQIAGIVLGLAAMGLLLQK
jgi:drug/metabolite transporter (DMT)-like permease